MNLKLNVPGRRWVSSQGAFQQKKRGQKETVRHRAMNIGLVRISAVAFNLLVPHFIF